MRSMLLRSDAGGVAGVVELGASGGGSADAARAGGEPPRARAGDDDSERARGATCSNAEPRPGSAYGANRCAFPSGAPCGPGGAGGGGSEYCCSRGWRLNSRPGGIWCGGKNGGGYNDGGYRYGRSGGCTGGPRDTSGAGEGREGPAGGEGARPAEHDESEFASIPSSAPESPPPPLELNHAAREMLVRTRTKIQESTEDSNSAVIPLRL